MLCSHLQRVLQVSWVDWLTNDGRFHANSRFRYRRNLRSLEENLEEQPSLVPKLHIPDRRTVPPATAPELVMFCRRVYDFRAKRLVEDKNKKK